MIVKTALSLFSGCGGDTLGLQRAGLSVLGYTEIDKMIQETHHMNFPDCQLIGDGDMTTIPDETFRKFSEKIDLVFAGFPCQGFSNAGKKKHNDDRNSLFHHFVRCVALVRPKIVVGENVKGLLTKTCDGEQKKTLYIDMIRDAFDGIGYTLVWKLYSCEKFVPQIRERLILVGVRRDPHTTINPHYLLAPDMSQDAPTQTLESIIEYSSEGETELHEDDVVDFSEIPERAFVKPVNDMDESSSSSSSTVHPYLMLKKTTRDAVYPHPDGKKYPNGLLSFGKRISPIHAEVIDRFRPSKTIICTYDNQPRLFVPQQRRDGTKTIRCLRINELKQIQGFPKDFVLKGTRKQQIHMIGNAVPPPLVSYIVGHILETPEKHEYSSVSRHDLFLSIFQRFSDNISTMAMTQRRDGNTQQLEYEYTTIFRNVLDSMRLRYTKAGSQRPVDYCVYHPRDPTENVSIEMKRTSVDKIMCNDTYPKPDVYYIILHEKKGVRWCTGHDLVRSCDPRVYDEYTHEIQRLRERFSKDGTVSMYARPNFSVSVSHLFA